MDTYSLDCAFDSSATADDSSKSIAMSYGYAKNTGSWVGQGQRPEAAKTGDQFSFGIYDMAGSATAAVVTVTFAKAHDPVTGQGDSPLNASDTDTLAAGVDVTLGSNGRSTGCNVVGTGGSLGPYSVANTGNYDISISVSVDGTTYAVDPELEVTRGVG